MEQTKSNIISLLKVKDKKAIELIYDNYSKSLYGVVLNMTKDEIDAQDIIQEAFIKIWKNSDKYDPGKAKLFTWLLTICRNVAIDKLRSKKNRSQKEIQKENINVYDNRSYNYNPDHLDLRDKVNSLDKKYAEVIDALYYGGMTQKEASEKLNLPLGTIKTRIKIGIRELNKIFGEKLINLIVILSVI